MLSCWICFKVLYWDFDYRDNWVLVSESMMVSSPGDKISSNNSFNFTYPNSDPKIRKVKSACLWQLKLPLRKSGVHGKFKSFIILPYKEECSK